MISPRALVLPIALLVHLGSCRERDDTDPASLPAVDSAVPAATMPPAPSVEATSPPIDGHEPAPVTREPGTPPVHSLSAAPDAAPAPADSGPAPATFDSVNYLVRLGRIPGRTQGDSISLAAAIRKGLRYSASYPAGPEPLPGALLPARRIVAFYGNPLSTRMGVLGALPPEQMLAKLDSLAQAWHAADSTTPVQPALHLIAVVAQDRPGRDGMYRLRMDSTVIERVYRWARSRNAILFLDIQAGASTIQQELPRLLPWLARPEVHLGIDPEFYMHYQSAGSRPGRRVGTITAAEVNHTIDALARLVGEHGLPPKVLVIHRFTVGMVQGASQIRLDPRVQVVSHMDGWGQPSHKFYSYAMSQVPEPIQFTGFKLFFHNDTKKGDALLTPKEVLALRPRPFYIQYQ